MSRPRKEGCDVQSRRVEDLLHQRLLVPSARQDNEPRLGETGSSFGDEDFVPVGGDR